MTTDVRADHWDLEQRAELQQPGDGDKAVRPVRHVVSKPVANVPTGTFCNGSWAAEADGRWSWWVSGGRSECHWITARRIDVDSSGWVEEGRELSVPVSLGPWLDPVRKRCRTGPNNTMIDGVHHHDVVLLGSM
ncbi:hypothetical protein LTS02_013242 [Friedmanniomyces endolithicus]|nr:hypothetical protein LTS02_013242 [Friedmanniomyces endolithicus]